MKQESSVQYVVSDVVDTSMLGALLLAVGPNGNAICASTNPQVGLLDLITRYSGANSPTVPAEYFCHLDGNLMRTDHQDRPELNKGTVDFSVPSAYYAEYPPPRIAPSYYDPVPPKPSSSRLPQPMRFLFVINVSSDAILSGLVQAACVAIKGVLFGGETPDGTRMDPCFPVGCRVAFMTYDNTLHYYDLSV